MNVFEKMLNDNYIIDGYKKISKDESWAHHGLEHVLNVSKMMETLLLDLGYDSHFIDEAKVAGLLHDLGRIEGRENHAYSSYLITKRYLASNNIHLKNENLVLDAIKTHSDGFDTDNIIALILMFCDKLDVKKSRVATEGYKVVGMRQFQYVEDVEVSINSKEVIVNFRVSEDFDKKELEEFYFTKKIFKAVKALAGKLGKIPRVSINDKIWDAY